MNKKKILTANLEIGMVTAEAVYNFSNHLIISSNTTLTPDIIDKLKYYSVKSVKIFIPVEYENTGPQIPEEYVKDLTYFEKIQVSEEFKVFESEFNTCVNDFKDELNDLVAKNGDGIIENMLGHVDQIFNRARNPLHLLDMMLCIRNYDDITYAHSMNVALICDIIGRWLKLSDDDLMTLVTAGLLHDIGKLKIPPGIIKKPGRLTNEEFAMIQKHPGYGFDILRTKNLDSRIANAALQHHERYNGRGYPDKLTGAETDFFASIVAIADVYDAMTSNRSYRKGICPFDVLEQMEREKDSYEPEVLHKFINNTAESYVNNEVMLSNGEHGRVILLNKNFLSRPLVAVGSSTYDLSKMRGLYIENII
ncbi:MAG: HD-GYP domain-containing protein [Lachnospiraceae bacterium]|nr:HD-GYP domain-containing protein [Lachnospiraceae bacterium]